jgi:hypothetical protein
MKLVINKDYGGFSLDEVSLALYNKLAGKSLDYSHDIERNDPALIEVVEAPGYVGDLVIVEIPDGVHFYINDYDGLESVIWSESELHFGGIKNG